MSDVGTENSDFFSFVARGFSLIFVLLNCKTALTPTRLSFPRGLELVNLQTWVLFSLLGWVIPGNIGRASCLCVFVVHPVPFGLEHLWSLSVPTEINEWLFVGTGWLVVFKTWAWASLLGGLALYILVKLYKRALCKGPIHYASQMGHGTGGISLQPTSYYHKAWVRYKVSEKH